MRQPPQSVMINGTCYEQERVLKDDFFSLNMLYKSPASDQRYVLKLSDFRFIFGKLLRPWAALMSNRESWIYAMVDGIEGVPPLGPRWGLRGYFHWFAPGHTLHELNPADNPLPDGFFTDLRRILEAVHARRILYVDLNKRGNVILGDDGRAYLIDYQICLPFPQKGALGPLSTLLIDPLFERLCREDLYHLYKHKRLFQPQLMSEEEITLATKSGLNLWYDRFVGTPYRKLKRLIYPQGSNETLWFIWKKQKDQAMRMP